MADENDIINATQWISTTPDMSQSVTWNMEFNNYNQTTMAHRSESNYKEIVAGLFWDMYS
jgi:hypothetical protein